MLTDPLDVATPLRSLLVSGFHLDASRRMVGHVILDVHRYDQFGIPVNYSIAVFGDVPPPAAVRGFLRAAQYNGRLPLLVAPSGDEFCRRLSVDDFCEQLGGVVDYSFLLRPDLPDSLDQLGHNRLPLGMDGKPEDLLEEQVARCLEYLLQKRARRWGGDRRFEPLPDGVAVGQSGLLLLYDAKAHSEGFDLTAAEMRKFHKYVEEFHRRYEEHLGRVHAFLVVSGSFRQREEQLRERSTELYAGCQVALCFLKARELGTVVAEVLKYPEVRGSVDWRRVFAEPTRAYSQLGKQVTTLLKDRLMERS